MYDDIALFIHIVRHNGLSAAASQLGVPAATMTRRLQKLEEALSCRLIHRSARQFILTHEGEAYYQAYADLIEQLEVTQRHLSDDMWEMEGKLRVLAPINISISALQPMWSEFIQSYPHIQLELSLSNQMTDLILSKADIALRIGPQKDSLLYQKRLGSLQMVFVASPAYIQQNGEPQHIDDLKSHRFVSPSSISVHSIYNSELNQKRDFHPKATTLANDLNLITQLVCDHVGISLLPTSEVKNAIENGRLRHILPQWRGPNRDIFAVWPTGKLLNAKAKCLRDYMSQYIEKNLSDSFLNQ